MPISDLVANAGCLGHISGRSPGRSRVATTPVRCDANDPNLASAVGDRKPAVARAQSCPTGEEERFQLAGESRLLELLPLGAPPNCYVFVGLLCARRQRPCDGRAANPCDELPPSHLTLPGRCTGKPMAAGCKGTGSAPSP